MTVVSGGQQVLVTGHNDTITLEFPSVTCAFRMLRQLGKVYLTRARFGLISKMLDQVGLVVVISTPSRKLATIGGSGNSWFMYFLGFPGTRLHLLKRNR